jgi:hypothetical protein
MLAVRSHNVGLVRKMLAKGADVDAQDAGGRTALEDAGQNVEIRATLRAGAHR